MMVETHLDPNTDGHQTRGQEVAGVIWGLEGDTRENDPYIIPNWYHRNGSDNTYCIVLFGPITSASCLCDEAQPMGTWAGVGLHMSVTPRSSQGHLKVTTMSNQPKRVKLVSFYSNCARLGCISWLKPISAPIRRYTKHISIYLFD